MDPFDPQPATCHVFTYRDGLLSAVGHDLKIRVGRFTVDVDPDASQVEARFDAASLHVVNAVEGQVERPDTPSAADKEKIRSEIRDQVLETKRYPEIHFLSTRITRVGDGYDVTGELNLHGHQKEIRFTTRKNGAHQVAEVSLHQPDFGIKPYRALLGALKVRPDVLVRVEVPLSPSMPVPAVPPRIAP